MATTTPTVPVARCQESEAQLDALDAFMARALTGRVSFAELVALSAMADAECRKAERVAK